MKKKIAIVTGGSSGIGLGICKRLAKKNYKVYEFSRHQVPLPKGVTHITCDISDAAQSKAAVAQVLSAEGRIDLLVNNAGFGISGAVEFTETADVRKQFDVNFFGLVDLTKEVIPVLRQQGSGCIVNVSSVASPIAIPFQAFYSASKAAITDYTLALKNELRPFGIKVICIWPGDIATGFTDAREKSPLGDDVYHGKISQSVASMEKDERNGMSADVAGKQIADICCKKHPAPVYTIGSVYKLFVFLQRLFPQSFLYYIVGKLY